MSDALYVYQHNPATKLTTATFTSVDIELAKGYSERYTLAEIEVDFKKYVTDMLSNPNG
jgi:hypothetical protein